MSNIPFAFAETPGLVSIVMPTHKGEKYIGATLESIGRQTYPHWELIVVEDHSRGPTEGIVRDFAARHPYNRVEYGRNDTDRGASRTRNQAFTRVRGEYVALLDCDDRWTPDHLASSVDTLRTGTGDIAYSTVVMVEDGTDHVLGVWGPTAPEAAYFDISLIRRNFVVPSASVMRRSVLADVGPWSTNCRYCEDYDFWLRCIAADKKFQLVSGCHCLYRKGHAGATTAKMSGLLEEFADITRWSFPILTKIGSKTLRRAAASGYALAARSHATLSPAADPSADATRAAKLYRTAWRLDRRRISYLMKSIYCTLRFGMRRAPALKIVSIPVAKPQADTGAPVRRAA